MSTTQETKGGRSTPPWLYVILFVSLAVNLLIAGAFGAMLYMHYAEKPPAWMERMAMRHNRLPENMRQLLAGRPGLLVRATWATLRALPPERKRALMQKLTPHREQVRKAYAEVARLRLRLVELLKDGSLDEQAYTALMKDLRRADLIARRHVIDLADTCIRALTPKERRIFARKLKRLAASARVLRPFRGLRG